MVELIPSRAWAATGRDPRALRHGGGAEAQRRTRIHSGVYADVEQWQAAPARDRHLGLMHGVAARAFRPPIFSHESAAELHGIPRLGPSPRRVTITVPTPSRSTAAVQRRCAELDPDEVVERQGLLLTSPVRTLVDLASTRSFTDAVVAGDHLLRADVRLDDVVDCLARRPTRRGFARADTVISFLDADAATPIESVSRANIHLLLLPPPLLQYPLYDEDGLIGYADFYWPELRLVGECDGRLKYLDAAYRNGRSAQQVVYDEKVREDRMRAVASAFTRWDWRTACDRDRLGAQLRRFGLRPVHEAG